MKKQTLPKTDAFFEGLPLILINGLTFDDNNRLIYKEYTESGEEKTVVVADWPCLTEDALLKAWYQAVQQYEKTMYFDESEQFPNKSLALSYALGARGIIYWNRNEEYEFETTPIFSVEYCKNALSNCFRHIYKFHYKLVATSDDPAFGFYDESCKIPKYDNVEYGSGVYKVEVEGHPEETIYVEFGGSFENQTNLPKGTYDVYIYSNQPTISIDNDQFFCNNGTLTYLESEHCISYILTTKGKGSVVFSGLMGSIEKISPDASVTVVKEDYDNNLFELSFDREGQYAVNVFCDDKDEEVRVQDSTNCSFGSRTVKW